MFFCGWKPVTDIEKGEPHPCKSLFAWLSWYALKWVMIDKRNQRMLYKQIQIRKSNKEKEGSHLRQKMSWVKKKKKTGKDDKLMQVTKKKSTQDFEYEIFYKELKLQILNLNKNGA